MIQSPDESEPIEIYGDESDRRGLPLVIGALCGDPIAIHHLREDIRRILSLHGWCDIGGELKSTKCTGSRLYPAYRDVITHVMTALETGVLEFRALAIERDVLSHPHWHGGDRRLAIFRAWQMLVMEPLASAKQCRVILDHRTTREKELFRLLTGHYPIFSARQQLKVVGGEFRTSHSDEILQTVDVLVGAIGYRFRMGRTAALPSPAKIALLREICYHLDGADLATPRENGPYKLTHITRYGSPSAHRPSAQALPIRVTRGPTNHEIRLVRSNGPVSAAA